MSTKRLRRPSSDHPASERSARLPAFDERQLELSHVLVDALLRRVNEDAERADRRAAEDAWDQGALLHELAGHLGSEDAAAARFIDGSAAARERMRIARATTRWLAGVYGLRRVRLGLALLDRLGLSSLDQLEATDLPGPNGTTVRFPATAESLTRALELLGNARVTEGSAASAP